jgi:predicted metal-dependent phosphoesterase TrpH
MPTPSPSSFAKRSLVDLHCHSTASDGLNPPAEVVRLASDRGLHYISLTDHDSTEGLDEALAAGRERGLSVIPGVELGTDVPAGELHMLGYFIDYRQDAFQARLESFRSGRETRAERIAAQLNAAGIPIRLEEVLAEAGDGAVSRAHVARVLIRHGRACSMDDAFARFLGRGQVGFVERPRLSPTEAVSLIQGAGGVAVLAHPYTVDDVERQLAELVAAGLEGIEVFYGPYSPEERRRLAQYADRYGLIATGGTDFHGVGEREGREIGSVFVPIEVVEQLRLAASH